MFTGIVPSVTRYEGKKERVRCVPSSGLRPNPQQGHRSKLKSAIRLASGEPGDGMGDDPDSVQLDVGPYWPC